MQIWISSPVPGSRIPIHSLLCISPSLKFQEVGIRPGFNPRHNERWRRDIANNGSCFGSRTTPMGICEISDGDLKDLWHDQGPQEEPLCQDQGESSKQYHGEQEIDFLKKSIERSLSFGCHIVHCCIPVSLLIGGWDWVQGDQYKEPMVNTEII